MSSLWSKTGMSRLNETKGSEDADIDTTNENIVNARFGSRSTSVEAHEETNTGIAEVFLSVIWASGKLGVAFYDCETTEVLLMLDTVETEDFRILEKVLQQVHYSCVVTSSKQDQRFVRALEEYVAKDFSVDESSSFVTDKIIHLLPGIDFSLDFCKRRIMHLNLPSIPAHFSNSEKTLYLTSLIPMEHVNMVRALGGLLKFLEKKRIGIELEDETTTVPILGVRIFSLDDLLLIDENSYSALHIFRQESHPSVFKTGCGSSAKEGLSLFGILNRCKSQMGSRLMRLWFMHPLKNIALLNERLDAVAYFTNPRNMEVVLSLQSCLKNVKSIPRILVRMRESQATPSDWQAIYKTVYNAVHIADLCRAQPKKTTAIFGKIVKAFTNDLDMIADLISKIVDFKESVAQNRFVVKPNVDPALDEKKRTFQGLPDFLTKIAQAEIYKYSSDISECNVIYLPQLGFLFATPVSPDLEEKQFMLPDLKFVFMSNGMVHYKSEKTRELDSRLGDTQCEIADQETSIMLNLQSTILEHTQALLQVMEYTAELDCLLSFATSANEGNYVKPKLTMNNELEIRGGRHALQELCCNPFVPNDTLSGGEHSKIKILTGPNASGKSVYLKQVALLVFMAQIGSFVPAESAMIGLVDQIFTRIRTMESVSVGLSTFMIDLNQVSTAVRSATERSLVLLDEFGKGTETTDGMSLLCSCLHYWLQRNKACPHVFVSTHFHSISQKHCLPTSKWLSFQTMDVLHNGPELVFLFQLVDGFATSSYACHIASLAGLPEAIVKRGTEVSDLFQKNEAVCRVDTPSMSTQLKKYTVILKAFLELNIDNGDIEDFMKSVVLPSTKE